MEYYKLEDGEKIYYIGVTSHSKSTFFHCKVHIRWKEPPNGLVGIKHFVEHRNKVLSVCDVPEKAEKTFVMMVIQQLLDVKKIDDLDLNNTDAVEDYLAKQLNEYDQHVN